VEISISTLRFNGVDREILPLYKGNKIMAENKNETMKKE